MPKSKLKSHHNGHAVTKGKGSIYQRNLQKREEDRLSRRENTSLPPSDVATTLSPS